MPAPQPVVHDVNQLRAVIIPLNRIADALEAIIERIDAAEARIAQEE